MKPVSGQSHSFHRAGRRLARKEQGSLCNETYFLRMIFLNFLYWPVFSHYFENDDDVTIDGNEHRDHCNLSLENDDDD